MTQHISRALALMIVTLAALTASAADYSVKGLVVDSIGDPESYATVRIYTLADSVKPAILGTADLDGAFSFKLPSAGNYRVRIHSVGKAPVVSDVTLSASRHTADLGRIVTRAASTELGEITVTALRPVVSREIDRIGYDVQADDESKTVTLDEMLKKASTPTAPSRSKARPTLKSIATADPTTRSLATPRKFSKPSRPR